MALANYADKAFPDATSIMQQERNAAVIHAVATITVATCLISNNRLRCPRTLTESRK